jgi:hypothetical protein
MAGAGAAILVQELEAAVGDGGAVRHGEPVSQTAHLLYTSDFV